MDFAFMLSTVNIVKAAVGVKKLAADVSRSVAQLLGYIESLDEKVDRLVSSELNAGLRNLDQAGKSDTETESLLRAARSCFNKAVDLERGYRQGLAFLGLALCHHYLGDQGNCHAALEQLLAMPPPVSELSMVLSHFRSTQGPMPGEHKSTYWKGRVLSAVKRNPDAKSLLELQEAVGKSLNKPLKWWEEHYPNPE
jgi:hypothetical protein